MRYGANSYYSLGRVYPRTRLRQPFEGFARRQVAHLFGTPSPPATPAGYFDYLSRLLGWFYAPASSGYRPRPRSLQRTTGGGTP